MNELKKYALYKGESLLASGTCLEIAKEIGVKPRTINYYGTPSYISRTKKGNAYRIVNICSDDLGEELNSKYEQALKLACLDIKNNSAPKGLSVKGYFEYYIRLLETNIL